MTSLNDLFDLEFDPREVANGPAFGTHSKDRSAYSSEQREQERERGLASHAREVEMVITWAGRLADHAGIPMTLPAPLLP
jgi:hypothetical protein